MEQTTIGVGSVAAPVNNGRIRFYSVRKVPDAKTPYKVRGGGFGSKTPLDSLATGEQMYAFGKPSHILRNKGRVNHDGTVHNFGKMGIFDNYQPTLATLTTEYTNRMGCGPTTEHIEVIKAIVNRGLWYYKHKVESIRKTTETTMTTNVDANLALDVKKLLKSLLLFKGYGFAQIQQRIEANGGKSATFNVNTTLCLNPQQTGMETDVIHLRIHSITVNKAFMGVEEYVMLFDDKTYKPIKRALTIILAGNAKDYAVA